MKERLLAGIIGLSLLIPALLYGGVVAVDVIVVLAVLIGLDEYARMAFPETLRPAHAGLAVIAALPLAGVFSLGLDGLGLGLGLGMVLGMCGVVWWPGPDLSRAGDRVGRVLTGLLWIAGGAAFLSLLRRLDDGLAWVLLALVIPWSGDTGAYFAGRAFGKRKLYERLSPKKTVEGLVGGLISAVLGLFAARALGATFLSVPDCLILGVGLGAVSVVGDLAESMLKRAYDVKDSGALLPGHGGLLDRIDSVLFVVPPLYAYAVLTQGG